MEKNGLSDKKIQLNFERNFFSLVAVFIKKYTEVVLSKNLDLLRRFLLWLKNWLSISSFIEILQLRWPSG